MKNVTLIDIYKLDPERIVLVKIQINSRQTVGKLKTNDESSKGLTSAFVLARLMINKHIHLCNFEKTLSLPYWYLVRYKNDDFDCHVPTLNASGTNVKPPFLTPKGWKD